jgi:hypothetical protein
MELVHFSESTEECNCPGIITVQLSRLRPCALSRYAFLAETFDFVCSNDDTIALKKLTTSLHFRSESGCDNFVCGSSLNVVKYRNKCL